MGIRLSGCALQKGRHSRCRSLTRRRRSGPSPPGGTSETPPDDATSPPPIRKADLARTCESDTLCEECLAAEGVSAAGAIQCSGWLQDHGFEVETPEPSVEAVAEATIWTVVAVSRADGPLAVKAILGQFDEAEVVVMVEAMGRVRSVYAGEALEAMA